MDPAKSLSSLEEGAQYNRNLIEACPCPLIAVDAGGRITDANDAFANTVGTSCENLIGTEFASSFTDPDLARTSYRETFARGLIQGFPLAVRDSSGKLTNLLFDAAIYLNRQNEVAGVVMIGHDVSQQMQRESDLARLHAELTAQAEELKQREAEIQQINVLYEVLQACNSQGEAYPIIRSVASQLFPLSGGALAVSVSQSHQMETAVEWGTGAKMADGFALNDCWALRRGQMQEVAGAGAIQTCRHFESRPTGPSICLPLTVRGDLLGLLSLRNGPGESILPQQRRLLIALGEVIKLSISSLKLRDALQAQAIRDPLTGLFNRNYLEETLRREVSRSARRLAPLCVAMLDIDGFKGFNDTYSHHAGDVLLKELGTFFLNKLRTSDIVCRYGGDEFVLVLPDTNLAQVSERLDSMRHKVKKMECTYEGQVLPAASISIGVVQWPDHGATPEDLLKAADGALYAAKHGGKDQVNVLRAAAGDRPK